MGWDDIEAEVRAKRRIGVVTILTLPRPAAASSREVADVLAESAHYRAIGNRWVSLSQGKASEVLRMILARDLAYDGVVMPAADAAKLAASFIAHVGDPAEYYTNGSWSEPPLVTPTFTRDATWEPLSAATFDAGVVAVGGASAAMLWVEDED